jgi:hypothetical protein
MARSKVVYLQLKGERWRPHRAEVHILTETYGVEVSVRICTITDKVWPL